MDIKRAVEILNLKSNYTLEELKKSYRLHAMKHHPDKNNNTENSTLIFQNINCAFRTLKDVISANDLSANDISANDVSANDLNNDDSYNNLLINFINNVINYYNNNNVLNLDEIKLEADKQLTLFLETLFSNLSLIILEDIYLLLAKYPNICLIYYFG